MSNVPSTVAVPQVSGTPQALIDNNTVSTSASAEAQRQVTSIGDPTTGANIQAVDASGNATVKLGASAGSQFTSVPINSSASSIQIAAGVTGKSVRLYRILLTINGVTNLTFEDNTTPLSGPMEFGQFGLLTLDNSGDPWYQSSAGNALNIGNSGGVQISGTAYYVQS